MFQIKGLLMSSLDAAVSLAPGLMDCMPLVPKRLAMLRNPFMDAYPMRPYVPNAIGVPVSLMANN